MKSGAETVDAYVDAQPDEWRPSLLRLRELCRRELVGYAEGMDHGMPAYARGGQMEVAFAKQARYLSLYILKQPVLDAHRGELAGISGGKGCIRYRRHDQIDWALVASLLSETCSNSDKIC
jgi:uncharacterized protein YdhG (YjbR/CyaY superfamily)